MSGSASTGSGPAPIRVGVDDDVHAGLGDDRLQVGDPGLVHADLLGQPGQRVADDRDVLAFAGSLI